MRKIPIVIALLVAFVLGGMSTIVVLPPRAEQVRTFISDFAMHKSKFPIYNTTLRTYSVKLKDGETKITRTIDFDAEVVLWTANSKTFGHAIAITSQPLENTAFRK